MRPGEPQANNPGKFKIFEIEGITVYVNLRLLSQNASVTLDLRRTLFGKEMFIREYQLL